MTPICSVLMPTRNRPELLQDSIDSFLQLAFHPQQVEIIVRVHDDDYGTLAWAGRRDRKVRVVIGDTEQGYGSLHKFMNCVAAMSDGDWLWPAGDDSRMLTAGWDRLLREHTLMPRETCTVLLPTVTNFPGRRYLVLSRGFYRALGHMGLTPHCDCYIDSLSHFAGVQEHIDIELEDMRPPYVSERDVPKTWAEYRSKESAHCFDVDKRKLGAVLGKNLGTWTTSDAPAVP